MTPLKVFSRAGAPPCCITWTLPAYNGAASTFTGCLLPFRACCNACRFSACTAIHAAFGRSAHPPRTRFTPRAVAMYLLLRRYLLRADGVGGFLCLPSHADRGTLALPGSLLRAFLPILGFSALPHLRFLCGQFLLDAVFVYARETPCSGYIPCGSARCVSACACLPAFPRGWACGNFSAFAVRSSTLQRC